MPAALSDAEARAYLSSKGVSTFIDGAVMRMLEELPDDPIAWFQAYAASARKANTGNTTKLRPGVAVGTREASGPMWSQIAERIPVGRMEEHQLARAELFTKIDVNGAQAISEAAAVQGVKAEYFNKGNADIDYVLHRAYQLVRKITKDAGEVRPSNTPPDHLTRPQFKLFLMYLRRYCMLLANFDEFDGDDDLMVDWEDFRKLAAKVDEWGILIYYPETAFRLLDKDGKQSIPFLDCADFIIGKELSAEPMTVELEVKAAELAEERTNQQLKGGRPLKGSVVSSFRRGRTGPIDWGLIAERLPYGRCEAEYARRKELWGLLDVNGNGYLSLAELDKGMRDILRLEDIYDCKPAMLRAFNAAKNVHKGTKARLGNDFVTRPEFRVLLEYLRKYFELFVMFDRMDENNDRRLTEKEFVSAGKKLAAWGVTATDLSAEFKKMDSNNSGMILFEDFCHWAIPQNLEVEDADDR